MTPAYEQGYNARCANWSKKANPYHRPDPQYYEWVRGWDAADEDTRKYP